MLKAFLLGFTFATFLYATLNIKLFKFQLPKDIYKILKIAHLILSGLFLSLLISHLFGGHYYYRGRYTTFLIFWGFLITGFCLAGFSIRIIKVSILSTYLSIFYIGWIIITLIAFVPFMGMFIANMLGPLATPPGKLEFNNENFRIEVDNVPQYMKAKAREPYLLIEKKGIFEVRNLFSSDVICDKGIQFYTANAYYTDDDSAAINISFTGGNCRDYRDTIVYSVHKKVKLN